MAPCRTFLSREINSAPRRAEVYRWDPGEKMIQQRLGAIRVSRFKRLARRKVPRRQHTQNIASHGASFVTAQCSSAWR